MKPEIISLPEWLAAQNIMSRYRATFPVVERAWTFADAAHRAVGQVRHYTGLPYFAHHPAEVALLVILAHGTPDMVAAALLHDVVEDTKVTHEDLKEVFGHDIAHMVYEVSTPESDLPRAERKAREAVRRSKISYSGQTITAADALHNASGLVAHADPAYARMYLGELKQRLELLGNAEPALLTRAKDAVDLELAKLPVPEPKIKLFPAVTAAVAKEMK